MANLYTGKQIIKAGEAFLTDDIYSDQVKHNHAMDVVSFWRSNHESPLEFALSVVKSVTHDIDKKAIYAKRLKRMPSIIKKLRRFERSGMKLKNMQDIGGCRVIVTTIKKMHKVVRELKKRPEFKAGSGKIRYKDYISHPKSDGYRSYHLIGKFPDANGGEKLVEVQVRTKLQHDWATTLEIVELFTGQALKSSGGTADWRKFFAEMSKQLALIERIHTFTTLSPREQQLRYFDLLNKSKDMLNSCILVHHLSRSLLVLQKLHGFTESLKFSNELLEQKPDTGYMLVTVDTKNNQLTCIQFEYNQNELAESEYTKAEKTHKNSDDVTVALVYASSFGGIKEAYPNYFADSYEFLNYLTLIAAAVQTLSPGFFRKVLNSFVGIPQV